MLMCNSYDVNEDGEFKLRDLSEAKCHSENDTGFDGEKEAPMAPNRTRIYDLPIWTLYH